MVEDEFNRRLTTIEIANEVMKKDQESLKKNQEDIVSDLKSMAHNLNEVTSNLSLLVNNTTYLTAAVDKLTSIADKNQRIEIDLVEMRSRTESLKKLWSYYDKLKERVDVQGTVSKGTTFVAGSTVIAVIALLVSTLGGGG